MLYPLQRNSILLEELRNNIPELREGGRVSLTFKTDNILDTLFDIAIGRKDAEIYKRTRHRITHFPDLHQSGSITIRFDSNKHLRDASGKFITPTKEV